MENLYEEAVRQREEKGAEQSVEQEAIGKLLELYADTDKLTDGQVAKLVAVLQKRENAVGFLTIASYTSIRECWIQDRLAE